MTETLTFSRIYKEDLDVGQGTVPIQLANGQIRSLTRINLASLLTQVTYVALANSSNPIVITNALPAGATIFAVTAQVLVNFGNSSGLTDIAIGDPNFYDLWGTIARDASSPTASRNFSANAMLHPYSADTDIILTGLGGNFDSTGQLEVTVRYLPEITHI